jgi:hypothetical protein
MAFCKQRSVLYLMMLGILAAYIYFFVLFQVSFQEQDYKLDLKTVRYNSSISNFET